MVAASGLLLSRLTARAKIRVEHNWFSWGEKETGEPFKLCGVHLMQKWSHMPTISAGRNQLPPSTPHSAELGIVPPDRHLLH